MSSSGKKLKNLVLSAAFLALALVLPFLTGQIPEIGNMLCPMHIPVLLCGFFCGPLYGLGIGLLAPLLRFVLFGMPPLFPTGLAMCFELGTYGLSAGLLYRYLPKKKPFVYVSLIGAMILGRAVWGGVQFVLYTTGKTNSFGWTMFATSAVVNAIPGIIVQIVLIPVLVMVLKKYTYDE